ncbi:hypothetical protein [Ectopseudomonas mendocina]|uniref:hypothetical protein n=1 Tax=Ectopseudomonas mendocina TaxID=300 RepID=UPI003F0120EE
MPKFSTLEILKSKAKQLAREQALQLAVAQEKLSADSGFATYHELVTVAQRNPLDPRLMVAAFGVEDFSEVIHENDVYSDLDQALEEMLSGAIADTYASEFSIHSLDITSANYKDDIGVLTLEASVTYRGKQDQERMFHGSVFFLSCVIEVKRRDGEWLLSEGGVSIMASETDADRDRQSEWEHRAQLAENDIDDTDDHPRIPMAQALADELNISLEDAGYLADAEVSTNESDEGLVYNYWIDFEPVAQGALREDLLKRFGTLQIELNANFFDDVEQDFD